MAPKLYMKYASPSCRAVLMVAKAIGLELELEEMADNFYMSAEFVELNPQHTIPTLEDDDFILWDSHAIAGYLIGQYSEDDSMYPKDDVKKRAVIDQRLHFENGILFERCLKQVYMPLHLGETEIPEEARDKLTEAFGMMEAFLKDKQWFVGDDVTIADLSILATVATIELCFPIDADRFPLLTDWLQRAKELPYFEEANRQGLDAFKELLPNIESSENTEDS